MENSNERISTSRDRPTHTNSISSTAGAVANMCVATGMTDKHIENTDERNNANFAPPCHRLQNFVFRVSSQNEKRGACTAAVWQDKVTEGSKRGKDRDKDWDKDRNKDNQNATCSSPWLLSLMPCSCRPCWSTLSVFFSQPALLQLSSWPRTPGVLRKYAMYGTSNSSSSQT